MTRALKDLWRGVYRHPLKLCGYIFLAFSVLWTITEALDFFVAGIVIKGRIALGVLVLLSLLYGFNKIWKRTKISIEIKHSDTCIVVVFGDLFKQDGIRAVTVNDCFDSEIGKPVSDKSLHGILIDHCFGGHGDAFDKQVAEELKDVPSDSIQRATGKTKRYPIGTTAMVTAEKDKYLLVALTKTDAATSKVAADVTMMWITLHQLWNRGRIESGGNPINVPLLGSGLSGIGLPTRDLLNLIILSAITESKAKPIARLIRIVLHRDRYEEIDLREVKQYWEE